MEVDLLEKSRAYIMEGKLEKAQIILRRILSENPNHAKALELSGDIAWKLGNNSEAIQRYDSACTKYSNINQYTDAIICLEKIIKIDRGREEIFSRLSDLYRFYGMPNHAILKMLEFCSWALDNKKESVFINCLRKVIDMQPKNLTLRLSFIKILYSLNQGKTAQDELTHLKHMAEEVQDGDLLREINEIMPKADGGEELDPKSRIELGNLLYEIGSKDEAIVEFNKAVNDLISNDENDEAIKVLNRIVEIDPSNRDAINKINELKGGGAAPAAAESKPVELEEPVVEDTEAAGTTETAAEEVSAEVEPVSGREFEPEFSEQRSIPDQIPTGDIQGMEIFEDLGKDIEGFKAAGDVPAPEQEQASSEADIPQLEGQIADIEFLLDQAEAPPVPSFEVAKEYDDFRNKIQWREDDQNKLLHVAKLALESQLYEAALAYITDLKQMKHTWPDSLEIYGSSMIRLGRYNEAMKAIAPSLLSEDLNEDKKTELRYLLAAAYEGMGDFDNAMREIERIIKINPNYKDVREIYSLLGGKELVIEVPKKVEKPAQPPVQIEKTIDEKIHVQPHEKRIPQEPFVEPASITQDKSEPISPFEGIQSDVDSKPVIYNEYSKPVEKTTQKKIDSIPEDFGGIDEKGGENIAFL